MPELPASDDTPPKEKQDPEVKHGGAQSVLWALLGLVLIGLFILVLRGHWFDLHSIAARWFGA